MFHYDYLYEREPTRVTPGWYIMKIDDPNAAPTVAKTIDDMFRNSTAPTKTGTEKAFAAGFASMWGNVKLLMSTIGMAVVFAILLVTANAMMMNQRERRSEVAVMKTVGFSDRRVFGPRASSRRRSSRSPARSSASARRWLCRSSRGFGDGGFLPGFHVTTGTLAVRRSGRAAAHRGERNLPGVAGREAARRAGAAEVE
jgi:putative ABC transport system permease protein